MNLVIITYEFIYGTFSGNGVLGSSLVGSLLIEQQDKVQYDITVWCCKPPLHDDDDDNDNDNNKNGKNDKNINNTKQSTIQSNCTIITNTLSKHQKWNCLDRNCAWETFTWDYCDDTNSLTTALCHADCIIVIDWTGAVAYRSIDWNNNIIQDSTKNPISTPPPVVYMNFRVYSLGFSNNSNNENENADENNKFYNRMEQLALKDATMIVALSETDKVALLKLIRDDASSSMVDDDTKNNKDVDIKVLLPPLRRDVEQIARKFESYQKTMPQDNNYNVDEFFRHQFQQNNNQGQLYTKLPQLLVNTNSSCAKKRFVSCLVRLSPEKDPLEFVHFCQQNKDIMNQFEYIPLLLAPSANTDPYASMIKQQLLSIFPKAVIVESFLLPIELCQVLSQSVLNVHPCAYDAFGMTIIEAASMGVPSLLLGYHVGATAILQSGGYFHAAVNSKNKYKDDYDNVQNILRDKANLQKVGQISRERALLWSEAAYSQQLVNWIIDMLSNPT